MIKVAGHWELSWNTPIKEAELWNLPLRDFKIKDWYMWPISGIRHNEYQVTLHEKSSFEEIIAENKDFPHVYIEPYNSMFENIKPQDLREFKHPKDALYIFGSAHFNPALKSARETDSIVMVPTIDNKGVLWPHQCLVAIFYDKLVKGWQ